MCTGEDAYEAAGPQVKAVAEEAQVQEELSDGLMANPKMCGEVVQLVRLV